MNFVDSSRASYQIQLYCWRSENVARINDHMLLTPNIFFSFTLIQAVTAQYVHTHARIDDLPRQMQVDSENETI